MSELRQWSQILQVESDFLTYHLTKLTNLVKNVRNKANPEPNEDMVEVKDLSKYLYAKEPEEPPFESFGLEEDVFLKLKKILFYNNYFGRYDFFFGFGHQRSISPAFYIQLLRMQIPKEQKRQSTEAAFCAFGICAYKSCM